MKTFDYFSSELQHDFIIISGSSDDFYINVSIYKTFEFSIFVISQIVIE